MSYEKARGFVTALGVAFILWGLIVVINYAFGMGTSGDASAVNQYHMGMIILGIAFQLLGIGFVLVAKK
ncbi:hypothetical protein DRO69_05490 [Candidatus Bathyarchaeota archaeon]|nr:MAG: hypothetical protein DRO69_05490 [Candidatus Bathyarchaeota archaeon]